MPYGSRRFFVELTICYMLELDVVLDLYLFSNAVESTVFRFNIECFARTLCVT